MDVDKWNVKGMEEDSKHLQYLIKTAKEEVNQEEDVVFKNKDGFFRRKEMDNEVGDFHLLDRHLDLFQHNRSHPTAKSEKPVPYLFMKSELCLDTIPSTSQDYTKELEGVTSRYKILKYQQDKDSKDLSSLNTRIRDLIYEKQLDQINFKLKKILEVAGKD